MSVRSQGTAGRRPGRTMTIAAIALLAAASLACGGSTEGFQGVPAPQSVVPGTAGRDCYFVNEPAATPTFASLARPGTRGNLALWSADLGPADSAELSVRWAEDRRLLWVEAIRSTLPPERLEALKQILLETMTDTARADWGVRVRVVGGDVAGVAPSVICPARARAFSGTMPRIVDMRTLQLLDRMRGRRFPVEVRIDDRGNILGVKLVRPTGYYDIDQYLISYVWQMSFWPKLHDGIGIPTTLETYIEIPRRWW